MFVFYCLETSLSHSKLKLKKLNKIPAFGQFYCLLTASYIATLLSTELLNKKKKSQLHLQKQYVCITA